MSISFCKPVVKPCAPVKTCAPVKAPCTPVKDCSPPPCKPAPTVCKSPLWSCAPTNDYCPPKYVKCIGTA